MTEKRATQAIDVCCELRAAGKAGDLAALQIMPSTLLLHVGGSECVGGCADGGS